MMYGILLTLVLIGCVSTGGEKEKVAKTYSVHSVARLASPKIRSFHHSLWTGDSMIILGGDVKQGVARETGVGGVYYPDSNLWREIKYPYTEQINFRYQSGVWTGKEVILWGGFDDADDAPVDKGYRYSYESGQWAETSTTGAPSARSGHSAVWFNNKMYVFGGYDQEDFLASLYTYDPASDVWTEMSDVPEEVSPRAYATAQVFEDKIYVWGGMNSEGTLKSGWIYDPGKDLWEPMAENKDIKGRISFTSVVTNDSMIIWGGQESLESSEAISDGWSYNFADNSWSNLTDNIRVPKPRMHHAAVWADNKMIIFGGVNKGRVYRSGLVYSPTDRKWKRLKTNHKMKRRYGHSMIWTGQDLVVWGGFKTTNHATNKKFVSKKSKGFMISIQDDLEEDLEAYSH